MRTALVLVVMFLAAASRAEQNPPAGPPPPPPVHALRATEPITIDGILDEAVWKTAEPIGLPTQSDPVRGAPCSQLTEIRVAYDDEAVYVGARMYDSHPDSIAAQLSRRDNTDGSDAFLAAFDTFHDRRTGYYFGVTAAGTQFDGTLMNDSWDDDSWDGVWSAKARRDAQGWTAELRVPFSQMRCAAGDHRVWGVNFKRVITRTNESDRLTYAPLGQSGFVSLFAELSGLDGIRSAHHVEVLPYTTGKAEYLTRDPGDPFRSAQKLTPALGADLRTNVGANLTLNATANPDFGQVEIDPAVVNLSDVETYFNEKRPFFTEGLSVFRAGNNGASDYWNFNWPEPTFFYTRRIGRAPEGSTPGNTSYADVPLATHILGALKLTGQPAQHWNFGTLHALTGKETADYLLDDGTRGSTAVEPVTYYGVVRAQRSFRDDRQGLGLMALETARSLAGTGLAGQLNRNSVVGVLDGWRFFDAKKNWVVSGYATGSRVEGDPERIAALEQSSVHYYQRPDRSDLGVDRNATSLSGYGARLWVNKQNGPWMSNSAIGFLSPGFENNDLGFDYRADVINGHLGLGYNWNKPNHWRKYFWMMGALAQGWDFRGDHTMSQLYFGSNLEQINAWSWRLNGGYSGRTLSDRATRGGPMMQNPPGGWGELYWDTNSQAKTFLSMSINANGDVVGGHEWSIAPAVTWKPASRLALSLGPNLDRAHGDAQYVTQAGDPFATNSYGSRYAFAEIDQTTLGAELRADCSLTPNLTLQLYVQPLVSAGRYSQYKELARPAGYAFNVYGSNGSTIRRDAGNRHYYADPDGAGPAAEIDLGDPDFTYRSVRGNAVLRWEYLPGSTAYLVWTQDRSGAIDDGGFHLTPTLSALSRTPANNRILVKVSHHFEL